jgi:hypothetical protein
MCSTLGSLQKVKRIKNGIGSIFDYQTKSFNLPFFQLIYTINDL